MKIDGTSLSPLGSVLAANRINQVEKKSREMGQDGVKVSDKAQLFQNLVQKVKEVPEIREERVREVIERINQGEFKVDADTIANKLLRGI